MAIGVRILSDNLSGLTTDVVYLPQSGGTVNLGTQVFPFNYISEYVYGTYNCYVPLYGYTYTLDILAVTPTPTPTNTPTNTQTPTITPTNTQTPTVTSTNTPTPTEPIRYIFSDICKSEFNSGAVCECPQVATIWGNNPVFSDSTAFFSDPSGPNTGNPSGWYLIDGIEYELSSDCGIGCTTGATIVSTSVCPVTPTPTPTNTETPTQTPTNTSTPTPTPTTTINYYYDSSPVCDTINPFENVVLDNDFCSATTITSTTSLPDGDYWLTEGSNRRLITSNLGSYTFSSICVACA